MCLVKNSGQSPVEDEVVYKVVVSRGSYYEGPYFSGVRYKIGVPAVSNRHWIYYFFFRKSSDTISRGIHVFNKLEHAKHFCKNYCFGMDKAILKCRALCKDFIGRGSPDWDDRCRYDCSVYHKILPLEVTDGLG